MKRKTLYGLSPEKLSRFLAIGLEDSDNLNSAPPEGTSSEALQKMLNTKLSELSSIRDSLPAILNQLPNKVLPAAEGTMAETLVASGVPISLIQTLKDYSKSLVRHAPREDQKVAARAVYYAAIANALIFHKHKITQHSYEKLQKAFAVLEQKAWIPSDLKDLFEKAEAACQKKKP